MAGSPVISLGSHPQGELRLLVHNTAGSRETCSANTSNGWKNTYGCCRSKHYPRLRTKSHQYMNNIVSFVLLRMFKLNSFVLMHAEISLVSDTAAHRNKQSVSHVLPAEENLRVLLLCQLPKGSLKHSPFTIKTSPTLGFRQMKGINSLSKCLCSESRCALVHATSMSE